MTALWPLPPSPDSLLYREVIEDIANEKEPEVARFKFRAVAEEDFFFYLKYASAMRDFRIEDPEHPRVGGLWIDEPWTFDRAREIQEDVAERRNDVFYNFGRFMLKTTLVTVHLTAWELLKNPSLRFLILTHKVDQVGVAMINAIMAEFEKNPMLLEHWPDRLAGDTRQYPQWNSGDAFTILRPHGPAEPSVTIASVLKLPTSRHYSRIIYDDCVVGETMQTPNATELTDERLRQSTSLAAEETLFRWVGTIWDDDDPHMRRVKNGTIKLRRLHPAFLREDGSNDFASIAEMDAEGIAQLRTKTFFLSQAYKMGEYQASCDLQQRPVAKGQQSFEMAWRRHYARTPKEERVGKNVYFVVDPAGDEDGADMTTIDVRGYGPDRNRYALDLWREKSLPLPQFLDLLFRLHAQWLPKMVFIEDYNNVGAHYGAILIEQNHQGYRFPVARLPKLHRPKEARIQMLQPPFQRGEIWYPEEGFGHGSRGDSRDTMLQFFRDEYGLWTPLKNSVRYDDALDAAAWYEQPETRGLFQYPIVHTQVTPGSVTLADVMKKKEPEISFWAM